MKYCLFIAFSLCFYFGYSQPDSLFFKSKIKKGGDQKKWSQTNKASAELNEVAFVNWNSGGSNSISALVGVVSDLNYTYNHLKWKNKGVVRYGINKQQNQELRKTSDEIDLSSTLGYQNDTLSNWFFSSRFNFKTQFTNGYNYPDISKPISKFMAPGYLFIGGGVEYGKNIEKFSTYFSPLTFKSTFVLDENLSNAGSFGVTPAVYDDEGNVIVDGERVRTEIGILLTNAFETEVFENVSIKNLISFYSDYLNNFGNVDVDWEINFDFKVNEFIKASLGSHIKYDNDVKTFEKSGVDDELIEKGAKIQWKQRLGIGVVVGF